MSSPAYPASDPPGPATPAPEAEVVREVERLASTGHRREAIVVAFETAYRDFELTFGLEVPPDWTYADVFAHAVRTDMGYAPVLLARLYALYAPARYGRPEDDVDGDPVPLLRAFYAEPPLQPRGSATATVLPYADRNRGRPVLVPSQRPPRAGAAP